MGIDNIHILIDPEPNRNRQIQIQIQTTQAHTLVEAHKHGEHPWGSMRRACPLCQQNK